MPKVRPESNDSNSVPSVSSSKLLRRRNRAAVLRRVIYLKRRCIRCYFVNVIFSFIFLMIVIDMMHTYWHLLVKSIYFLVSRSCFGASLVLILLGSVFSIYSISKKLKKACFVVGNLSIALGVALNALVLVNIFIPIIPLDASKYYGYPKDLVEDCQAYPDHVFKFFEKPERRKGRPVVDALEDMPQEEEGGEDEEDEGENSPGAVTEEVTEKYVCDEMLSNIKWFERTLYLIPVMLIVASVTLTLALMGIVHLWYIHLGGIDYSILPPSLVEPYAFYDELMKRNHSIASIPDNVGDGQLQKEEEKKKVDLNQAKPKPNIVKLENEKEKPSVK